MSRPSTAAGIVGRRVRVDVPATSANLGAGFDSLALALDLANVIDVEVLPPGSRPDVLVQVVGEGAGQLPTGRRNHFVVSLLEGLADAGLAASALGWRIRMDNRIPVSRGLGSSASATVAALAAADALLDGALGQARILELATRDEGHADNAAAALYGGFCVATVADGQPLAVRFDPPAGLLVALYVPDRHLLTSAMRAALPSRVPFADAVHNVGAAALAVAALGQGRLDLLSAATVDRIHEPYRAAAYPELPELVAAARAAGAMGACLSGAGSSVIAFSSDPAAAATIAAAMERRALALGLSGRPLVQSVRAEGARVLATPAETRARPGTALA